MKKMILLLVLFLVPSIMMAQENPNADEVMIQFITINGYSNNLYIDNISAGNQYALDAAVTSINNIDKDTSYTVGSSPFTIQPKVNISNLGSSDITTSFNVLMTVEPGGYSSTKSVASLNSGESVEVTFDDLTITPGTGINFTITSQLAGDENSENDVLTQYSMVLAGVQRANILFEEWTNTSCGPCASNNPTIDAFVAANFSTIVPVKYHVWWPGANDPMYQYNIPEATNRTEYYGVGGVPHVIMGGEIHPVYPYTTPGSLQDGYDAQISKGTPLEVSVTDTRVTGDSIKADVTLTLHAPLVAGDYYLRVMAVEREINYASPPGSNGEKDFFDVFRKAYPDIIGTTIPNAVGTYNYSFTYPIDMAVWVDSMIYSIAFVQDDATKKVWGSDKGRDLVVDMNTVNPIEFVEKPIARLDGISNQPQSIFIELYDPMSGFNVELFEGTFPPAGWQVINPDGGITFEQFDGANGPTLGGSKSVLLDFYSYGDTGESDTMNTRIFTSLEPTDSVKFDYAHAEYGGSYGPDRLIVRVSIDGGQTFPFTIFDKEGSDLATVPNTTANFVPANSSEWATFSYSLESIIPVELTSFTAEARSEGVVLRWTTATELNNLGFEIERSNDGEEFYTIGFVEGMGTTTETTNYIYSDKLVYSGSTTYSYRLKQLDFNGRFEYSEVLTVDFNVPGEFVLNQNYPNPFNPSTKIKYAVPEESPVSIKVFDLTGREVATLVDEVKQPGTYELTFDAEKYASGVYIYQMISGDFVQVKKMSLLK